MLGLYSDPFDWINVLFYGGFIQDRATTSISLYMDLPRWNRKMEAAAKARRAESVSRSYGQMDLDSDA